MARLLLLLAMRGETLAGRGLVGGGYPVLVVWCVLMLLIICGEGWRGRRVSSRRKRARSRR